MRNKQLGTVAVVLASLGILVGVEELLAGGLYGFGGGHGSGSNAAIEQAVGGVMVVGGILLAMSVWLLVVGLLMLANRGAALAKAWAVFGVLAAAGLVIDAVRARAAVASIIDEGRFYFPGYLSDLGAAKIPVLGLLAVFPIVLLLAGPKRRPPAAR